MEQTEENKELQGYWGVSYPINDFYKKVRDVAKLLNMNLETFVKEAIIEKTQSVESETLLKG